MVSTNRKNLQIIEYCFKLTENRFSLAGMENMFKNTWKKLLWKEYLKNQRKSLPIAVKSALNGPLS